MSLRALPLLPLLAVAGFASLVSMRLCDAMLPVLAREFAVSPPAAAAVISSFAITYGLMQLVLGALGDRYGKARVIALACAWCALATTAAALAPSLRGLVLARAAMGGGAAAIVPLALAWIGDTVPMERRQAVLARYSSATVSGIMVGAWIGGFVTDTLGWRQTFAIVAPLFLLTALALAQHATGAAAAAADTGADATRYLQRVRAVLARPWPRTVLLTVFFEGVFAFGFLALLPSVLHRRFALPLADAGAMLALFALGGLAFAQVSRRVVASLAPSAQARLGVALLGVGYALLAAMPQWHWALFACPLAGFGFYTFHNTMQLHATQLSTTSRGLGVSLFGCTLFLGQSVGVPVAAQVLTRWHSAWGFAGAGLGLALTGLFFARALARHAAAQGDHSG